MKRLFALALVIGVACGQAQPAVTILPRSTEEANPRQAAEDLEGAIRGESAGVSPGVSLVPLSIPEFIFGPATAVAEVQPPSWTLAGLIPKHRKLTVRPLPSGQGTSAINLIEVSTFEERWGRLMTPAQRTIFAAFAEDEDLGEWLVIVNDVEVTDGPDPVPLTAYRWTRVAVEAYALCGIPPSEIDDCTRAFYHSSETMLVGVGARFADR
ncbi:MAG: hypothetical protein ACRDGU_01280 [Actinomycetota bacterium]